MYTKIYCFRKPITIWDFHDLYENIRTASAKKYESYQYCYISTPYQEIGDGGFTTVNTSSMEQVEYANMKLQYP